ncbi:MAG: hypothetical protein ACJAZF_005058 [Granulosicoccus sp.]|jgi:hypothetical protein
MSVSIIIFLSYAFQFLRTVPSKSQQVVIYIAEFNPLAMMPSRKLEPSRQYNSS